MSEGDSAWAGGRRAWDRLAGWHSDKPGRSEDASALDALDDVGTVRRLLDQAELVAVRTARRRGKSWAEIATRLGVTRQSAWERWRDLDETRTGPPELSSPPRGGLPMVEDALSGAARALRRRSTVTVPNVIGRTWEQALDLLRDIGLVGVGPDPDIPADRTGTVVTDQSPESGASVPRGSSVTLWTERGGGSGVREPRRPKIPPAAGRQLRAESSQEAVG